MAGHSKWAQIKRAKAVTDAVRSRVFSKFAREVAMESKKAGGNVSSPGLAAVIARAKAANMPKENIERAVAKGASKDSNALEEVVYEFYGPAGCAVVVTAVTDSRNRTTQEIKLILTKNEYALGSPGSCLWAFTKSGYGMYAPNEPLVELPEAEEESLQKLFTLLDENGDVQNIFTNVKGYESSGD